MSIHLTFDPHRRSGAAGGRVVVALACLLGLCVGIWATAQGDRASIGTVAQGVAAQDPQTDLVELARRNLLVPVQGVARNQLAPSFTQTREGHVHEAIDIPAPRGTPVLATEAGSIAKLFTSKPGGLTIYQFDPSGHYAYYYAHLDRYAEGLAEGREVARGDVLGYVGSTGNASPSHPHLHFAIFKLGPEQHWWQGVALDPYAIFMAASESTGIPQIR